ncbi:cytochrome C [Paracoccus sp. S-4012]|uniref:cytochrome c3 family protein n=1 Tax=Paracoccus sp. S-4012 TaxID=2665648 RepID=UPI0012AFE071|nr:cytochrome c3 family protein [Paracoccus sp. S-4012]MRX49925.1 cytochrome C [Paracoccus sp. S-4012]
MAQIFRPSANTVVRLALLALALLPLAGVGLAMGVVRSEYLTGRDRTPTQPVPFSHAHHTAEVGIDCRYCHTAVEVSARAGIPPTATCMTCHSQLWTDAEMLEPVRRSFATGERLRWTPVNRLPGYVYFDHSIHVAKGVACTTCHGGVGAMRLTRQHAPLTMGWCLDCHRNPGPRLSRRSRPPVPPRFTRS